MMKQPTLQPGDLVADRFRIDRQIGSGGMGAVYRALDRLHGDAPLAVKVLHDLEPSAVARFRREADVLSALDHPSIVRYFSHGLTSHGNPFLAMEWLEGEDLATRLRRGPLSVPEAMALAGRVGAALGFAHQMRIVHRDLKPGNIFLVQRDVEKVKILDFGVALASTAALTLTATAEMVGTPFYLAPEQAHGSHRVTPRADVFSLGCVLFECLTGRKAFDGDSVLAILAKILLCENPLAGIRFEGIPEPLLAIVARMLAKEPGCRPADGTEVAQLFTDYAASSQFAGTEVEPLPSLSGREQKLVTMIVGKPRRTRQGEGPDSLATRSLEQAARTYGASWESLADGSVFLTMTGSDLAQDQACRAARCAVTLRQALPAGDWVITTGSSELNGATPTWQATDRIAEMLNELKEGQSAEPNGIFLDDSTAGLLRGHFAIREHDGVKTLGGEAGGGLSAWSLLGRPTPFVGRDREMGTLHGLLAECSADSVARAALLTAAAGLGKSRLIDEFQAEVNLAGGTTIWTARGDPMSCGAPFVLLREMIRGAIGLQPGESEKERREKLDRVLGRILKGERREAVAHFIGPLIGVTTGGHSLAERSDQELNPRAQGDQLRGAVEDWVAAECAVRPLLIVLEDLHWGDVPTVRCLDAVLRNLSDCPLFVLGTARPEVHDVFPGLWSARGLQELRMGPLSRRAAERLVKEVLGASAPDGILTKIVAQSAGSPFYVEELVRAFYDNPALTLPGSVVAMVLSRLERLPAEARRVLRAAGVFGQVFWPGGVACLLGREWRPEDVEAWLVRLLDDEVVLPATESRFPGEKEYEFRHAALREAAYGMLTAPDRALGHRLAAKWLAKAGESNSRILAEHHERGGETEPAARLYRLAAEQALEGNDLEGTLHCVQRTIALGVAGELRGEVRAVEAEALDWLGRMDETIRAGHEAMALLPRYGTGWLHSAGLIAEAAGTCGDMETVEAMAAELLEAVREIPPSVALVRACEHAAAKLLLGGRPQAAEPLLKSLQGRTLPDAPLFRAWLERWLGFKCLVQGDSAGFLVLMERSAENFTRAGDLRNACLQRGNAGWAYGDLGAYDDARRVLATALHAAEKLGLEGVAASVRTDLCPVLACLGLSDEALEAGAKAAAVAAEQGERRLEATARLQRARVFLDRSALTDAEGEVARALACAEQILPTRAYALGVKAKIDLRRGKPANALKAAAEGMAILRTLGALDAGEAYLRLVHAEALAGCGDLAAAAAAVGEAGKNLRQRAERIVDPEWRKSFQERVPENRLTAEWALRLGGDPLTRPGEAERS